MLGLFKSKWDFYQAQQVIMRQDLLKMDCSLVSNPTPINLSFPFKIFHLILSIILMPFIICLRLARKMQNKSFNLKIDQSREFNEFYHLIQRSPSYSNRVKLCQEEKKIFQAKYGENHAFNFNSLKFNISNCFASNKFLLVFVDFPKSSLCNKICKEVWANKDFLTLLHSYNCICLKLDFENLHQLELCHFFGENFLKEIMLVSIFMPKISRNEKLLKFATITLDTDIQMFKKSLIEKIESANEELEKNFEDTINSFTDSYHSESFQVASKIDFLKRKQLAHDKRCKIKQTLLTDHILE